MKSNTFFTQTHCDRCGKDLKIRTTSWFTEETICHICMGKEQILKFEMKEQGYDPDKFEGCGKDTYELVRKAIQGLL